MYDKNLERETWRNDSDLICKHHSQEISTKDKSVFIKCLILPFYYAEK